jgi:hypothetical protein
MRRVSMHACMQLCSAAGSAQSERQHQGRPGRQGFDVRRQNWQVYGAGVWASLALMCASAVCGSITDLAFDLEGYLWQLVRPLGCTRTRNLLGAQHAGMMHGKGGVWRGGNAPVRVRAGQLPVHGELLAVPARRHGHSGAGERSPRIPLPPHQPPLAATSVWASVS